MVKKAELVQLITLSWPNITARLEFPRAVCLHNHHLQPAEIKEKKECLLSSPRQPAAKVQKYLVWRRARDSSPVIPNEGQIWLQLSLEKLWSPEILMVRQSLWLLNGFQRVSFLPTAQPWDRAMAELKGYFALFQGQIHILWLCLEFPFKWEPCKLQEKEGGGDKEEENEVYITFWPLKYSPPKRISSSLSGWAQREQFSLKEKWMEKA